jgi:ribosomal protein L37E
VTPHGNDPARCRRCGVELGLDAPMIVEYREDLDPDIPRVEVIGPFETPSESRRVQASYHQECHRIEQAEFNAAREWPFD